MCFGGKKAAAIETPAAAPAPPLEGPEEAEIGAKRKDEEEEQFGTDGPNYRVNRSLGSGVGGGSGLQM